ncbi:hypothetical protein MESS2_980022 [Mesorhizobium metallidurans STM 2683]|uniref:Uncharacterized protein n=1 Tax=Mesorhizobium metallidurans STM 2683 TaxID=1297569 RepID=M5EZD0_9HYPH|nr:hypothetical protein MESS2_980022 [Mesorhizobium metallidurans STM 2683]
MADLELRGIECAAWVPTEVDLPIQEQCALPNLLVYLTRKAQIGRPGTHSNTRELHLSCSYSVSQLGEVRGRYRPRPLASALRGHSRPRCRWTRWSLPPLWRGGREAQETLPSG